MKNHKKVIISSLLLTAMIAVSSCESTVKIESSDDEYKEKYESVVTEIQSAVEEENKQLLVISMAKTIYTGMSTYITRKGVNGETIPSDVKFENIKDELIEKCGVDEIEQYLDEAVVDIQIETTDIGQNVKSVTVTYKDTTGTYPE